MTGAKDPSRRDSFERRAAETRASRERVMNVVKKKRVALFVDRVSNQWVVRDPDGDFWIVPPGENGWERRRRFDPTEAPELEAIPGHYLYLLDLPF
jgi:hypothetical protein